MTAHHFSFRWSAPRLVATACTLAVALACATATPPALAKKEKAAADKHAAAEKTAAADKHGATEKSAAAEKSGHAVHWSYEGSTGPENWGEMDQKFGTCSLGKTQSPIDIPADNVPAAALEPIKFDYQTSPLKIIDNGHTVQVNYAPGSSITVAGKKYDLLQFHFHKPSEEKLNGKSYAMVAHLVHKDAEGKLAVVGVLLESGARAPLIQAVFDNLPKEKEKETSVPGVAIDIGALLPADRSYFTFQGSLTTPPCSEGVTWFVLKNPVKISRKQIAKFGRVYAMNARPVQPLNGRTIKASTN